MAFHPGAFQHDGFLVVTVGPAATIIAADDAPPAPIEVADVGPLIVDVANLPPSNAEVADHPPTITSATE